MKIKLHSKHLLHKLIIIIIETKIINFGLYLCVEQHIIQI